MPPVGTALIATVAIRKDGALYDPASPPQVMYALKPDGTAGDLVVPAEMTKVEDGIYQLEVFAAGEVDQYDFYQTNVHTDDPEVDADCVDIPYGWTVSATADPWATTSLDSLLNYPAGSAGNLLYSIFTKTQLIGTGVAFVQAAVDPVTGRTRLVKGSVHKAIYGLALEYEFSGYPAFPEGASTTWFGSTRYADRPFHKAGTRLTATKVRFELTSDESKQIVKGVCAIEVVLAPGDTLRIPNLPLEVLDSLGA